MKTIYAFLGLFWASLIVMVVVDFVLGPRAEFLNAYSVVERIIGQTPSAGDSAVAQKLGAFGEFAAVLAANAALGGILTVLVRWFAKQ